MNAKNLKYMQMFEEMAKDDLFADFELTLRRIKKFISLDFSLACNIWDYIATTRESEYTTSQDRCLLLGQQMFQLFYADSPTKCIKFLCETPSVRRAYYQYCASSCENEGFNILADLLVCNKVDYADEILKCIIKNENVDFGAFMKTIMEHVFIELLKKNPAKIEMSKKLSTLLLNYVKRIKTDERAMLEQRLREIQ